MDKKRTLLCGLAIIGVCILAVIILLTFNRTTEREATPEEMEAYAHYVVDWQSLPIAQEGMTDKEITLSVGQSVTVKNLKIVEKTQLYWGDAANGYSEDEHYANAVRTYTIVGPQITLAVDYEYLKDAYYGISYTCMFPINKKYGLYCAFLDDEELLFVAETLKVGAADYSGKFYQGHAADRCIMWGYDGMEKYKFDVRVLTPSTSCNNYDNKMQVAFWDMNTTTNKLYYSKWDGGADDMMKAGSTLHTECQWTFYIDD